MGNSKYNLQLNSETAVCFSECPVVISFLSWDVPGAHSPPPIGFITFPAVQLSFFQCEGEFPMRRNHSTLENHGCSACVLIVLRLLYFVTFPLCTCSKPVWNWCVIIGPSVVCHLHGAETFKHRLCPKSTVCTHSLCIRNQHEHAFCTDLRLYNIQRAKCQSNWRWNVTARRLNQFCRIQLFVVFPTESSFSIIF